MPKTAKQATARQRAISEPAPKRLPRTEDHVYGLVSVLYHALQGAQTYAQYIEDASEASDDELVRFFEQCREEEAVRAARAKQLLIDRTELEDSGDDDEGDEDDE